MKSKSSVLLSTAPRTKKHFEHVIVFILLFKVGSINSIFYFLHKAAEPFNCLEQDNLA